MSPKTTKQFKSIREEKMTLIMDVALQQFADEGYFKTTITQIARHAGISKGLMYNYFESKEELLIAIINRSMSEISQYFDPDKDGYLSEEEFELFIRKLFSILRENISFWRLFSQLMIQRDVREQFLKLKPGEISSVQIMYVNRNNTFLILLSKMVEEYFIRKKKRKTADYDPLLDMNMFIYTIEGFVQVTIYQDEVDEYYYNKAIDKIIEFSYADNRSGKRSGSVVSETREGNVELESFNKQAY
jgi:AcrR family transcriptional regulator